MSRIKGPRQPEIDQNRAMECQKVLEEAYNKLAVWDTLWLLLDGMQGLMPLTWSSSWNQALWEIGRVERTLFIIDWTLDTDMQRRAQIGLNKGESHHALKNAESRKFCGALYAASA